MVAYPYYAKDSRDDLLRSDDGRARRRREAGDLVLLHGCCHNPTGADLDMDQWRAVADLVAARGLIPFVDLAYQGFGDGLEADAAGTRLVVEAAEQAIVAQSCDKNFGCYRDRLGTLFVKASSADAAPRSRSAICSAWRGPCGRCRPIIRRRWRGSSSTIRSCAPTGVPSSTRCAARIRQLRAPARRLRSAARLYRAGRTACSRCCR